MSPAPSQLWRPIDIPEGFFSREVEELRAVEQFWRRESQRPHIQRSLGAFNERMARWWSIETGIIERLYEVSEGITLQLVEHGFEASLIPHGESNIPADELVAILRDHRESLDGVMDVGGGTRRLTTSWIKELHALLTRHQPTTEAVTPQGQWVSVPLLRGDWKKRPNNPLTSSGALHEYCPPELVASEMDRLIAIYEGLPPAPELRAAWLHHAFTQIHPFQDGNGRVARALASVDFIKAGLFPMLVRRQERDRYIDALRSADEGDLAPLVRYFADVQQALLRRAISEAEGVIDARAGLSTVLAAAAQKRERRVDAAAQQRAELLRRMRGLMDLAQAELVAVQREVLAQVRGIRSPEVQRADQSTGYFFRSQLLELARQHDYWADLNEQRDWVRLQLKDGGLTDIVVACHFIGNAASGAGVAVIFVEHRDAGERAGSYVPMSAAAEPLTLLVDEDEAAQRHRFQGWLELARNAALAQWTRFL